MNTKKIRKMLGKTWDTIKGPAKKFYSQDGEDAILARVFENQKKGFFVDIGAYHPKKISNTYLFYKKGWRGINVDANKSTIQQFKTCRRRDVNLHFAVGKNTGVTNFYRFNGSHSAINTLDSNMAEFRKNQGYNFDRIVSVNETTLENIFFQHLPPGTTIDFLSIDIEGGELNALSSNNWEKYRPKIIVAECLGPEGSGNLPLTEVLNDELTRFLVGQAYIPFAKTVNSVFFFDQSAQ